LTSCCIHAGFVRAFGSVAALLSVVPGGICEFGCLRQVTSKMYCCQSSLRTKFTDYLDWIVLIITCDVCWTSTFERNFGSCSLSKLFRCQLHCGRATPLLTVILDCRRCCFRSLSWLVSTMNSMKPYAISWVDRPGFVSQSVGSCWFLWFWRILVLRSTISLVVPPHGCQWNS